MRRVRDADATAPARQSRTTRPFTPATLAELHRQAQLRLRAAGVSTPDLDARLLVEHVSGTSAADRIARPEMSVDRLVAAAVEAAVGRRIGGEPVHRILGFREFYGLRLAMSQGTLEPRPDTEILVDTLLPFLRRVAVRQGSCRLLDLGTGTGAIALAAAAEVPELIATGVDICQDALATARKNARTLGLAARFTALRSDWFEKISGRYDAIASNPPYIRSSELATLPNEVRNFDPAPALDGGADGLDAYRVVAECGKAHLEPGGVVVVEIGMLQKSDVEELFAAAGYGLRDVRRDLAGRDRVLFFHCH